MLSTAILETQVAVELPAREMLAGSNRTNKIKNKFKGVQVGVNVGIGNGDGVQGNRNDSSTNGVNNNSADGNSQNNGDALILGYKK